MTTFDPTAPLAGPPEPWAATDTPSGRDGPPFHMTDMIAAEPYLARRLLARLASPVSAAAGLAAAIRDAATARESIVVTGCGTSEHAALGAVDILGEALKTAGLPTGALAAGQAFEVALDPPRGGLVIGISHEGATWATNRALEAARDAGARVALITVSDRSPGAALAERSLLVTTAELDTSWCHTIGYVAPLLAATAVAAHLEGRPVDPDAVGDLMAAGSVDTATAEAIAAELGRAEGLIVIGAGADRTAGRELTLKIEEAAWVPTAYRDLETFLHGHLPATGERTGLVLLLTDRRRLGDRAARAQALLTASQAVGTGAAAILSEAATRELPPQATPAGRLIVPDAPGLAPAVAALLGSATALQLLSERIARARGTNPDPIRRDDPRYRQAAAAAETI